MDNLARATFDPTAPLAPQIYAYLRALITRNAVYPGQPLAEQRLALRLAVPQPALREAILRLEEEGLVETYPQSATKVAKIDLQSVREAQFLRISVELEVVRKLALADGLDLFPIESLILQQERFLQREDFSAFAEADREMHRKMQDMAGVPGLWSLIRSRSGHLDRLRHLHLPTPGKAQSVIVGHRGILTALERRDPDAAQAALRRHLSGTLASVEDLRDRFPDHITD